MLHDDYTAAAALLQNDPQEGLRRLMELFGGPVHAICTAILRGHAEDADEAAADTFVRLWRNASSLPAGTALRGYVVRTARSCAIDRYRALTRRGVLFPLDGREEDMDFAVRTGKPPGNAGACGDDFGAAAAGRGNISTALFVL